MGRLSEALMPRALSPENPANPLQPSSWLSLMVGSGEEGMPITDHSALRISAVQAAIKVLSETMASFPCGVFQKTAHGARRAEDHRLYGMLSGAWNSQMTQAVGVSAVQAQAAIRGNGYAVIQRDGASRPVGLWPMPSDKMHARRVNGVLEYMTTATPEGRGIKIEPEDVIYIPYLSFDGIQAFNPIDLNRQGIAISAAASRFGEMFFSRGSRPSGTLEHPGTLKPEGRQNLQRTWQEATSGANALGVAVLEEGMKFTPMTINPSDAQFIETRKFQLDEIARMWRVPPHMLGILERSTNNNIEQQALEFIQYTMLPWVTKWEQELNRKLFAGTTFYVKFDMDGLLRGDFLSRMQGYQILRNSGIASANFVNQKEGWNLIPADQGGDIVLAPLNMVPLSQLAKEPEPTEPSQAMLGDGQQARFGRNFAHLFLDATGRMLNRDKRDEAYTQRVWAPVLTALADSLASLQSAEPLKDETHTFIRGYTQGLSHRSAEWKSEQKSSIAAEEFNRAYKALTERA